MGGFHPLPDVGGSAPGLPRDEASDQFLTIFVLAVQESCRGKELVKALVEKVEHVKKFPVDDRKRVETARDPLDL